VEDIEFHSKHGSKLDIYKSGDSRKVGGVGGLLRLPQGSKDANIAAELESVSAALFGADVNGVSHIRTTRTDVTLTTETPASSTKSSKKLLPVIIFIHGSSTPHIAGSSKSYYKALGKNLARMRGSVVVVPDLKCNGTADELISDISSCINWTMENIYIYRGDFTDITVIGFSQGSQMLVTLFLKNSIIASEYQESHYTSQSSLNNFEEIDGCVEEREEIIIRDPKAPKYFKIRRVILIAGSYNLDKRHSLDVLLGIHDNLSNTSRLFGGANSRSKNSPIRILEGLLRTRFENGILLNHVPRSWVLIHGHRDNLVSFSESEELFELLQRAGMNDVALMSTEEKDHFQNTSKI